MKTKTGFILIGLMVLFFITCRKDKDDPAGGNKIELGVNLIDTISYFFTGIQTEVISLGGNEIIQHGHCWNTETNPTINENHTLLGKLNSKIDFLSTVDTLLPNTVYYIRPYIQTAYAVAYGEEEQIKTLKTGKPVVSTNPVSEITLTSALCGGIVTCDSGLVVTARGVCWDTTGIFRIDSCLGFTIDSLGLGSFSSDVTGLHEGTNYHIAAYATNEKGTGYGEIKEFIAIPILTPLVTTASITNITSISAQCGGNVTNAGNGSVTSRGVCWSKTINPSVLNNLGYTEDGNGLGVFISDISNLEDGTTYYVVAYASNEIQTGYGEIISFTTLTLPTLTTSSITNITSTTATSGGNVIDDGGALVTARGVCWSTSQNPSISNSHTTDGSGTGSFISNITGLSPNTTYYMRAFATNSEGTSYGNQENFTTQSGIPCPGTPTVIYEGQTYNTVQIGEQCWFKENLNIGTMINGGNGQTNNSQIEKYCYGNAPANCATYGGLYQWNEMMQYSTQQGTKGICPVGWHLPTDEEWCTVTKFIEPSVNCNVYGWTGSPVGTKMKNTSGWNSGGNGTNISGFTALPGGYRTDLSNFSQLGNQTFIWTSNEVNSSMAMFRALTFNNPNVYRSTDDKYNGFSVRCLKD
jgi:uncharacterized protein (TIGR02145 family)